MGFSFHLHFWQPCPFLLNHFRSFHVTESLVKINFKKNQSLLLNQDLRYKPKFYMYVTTRIYASLLSPNNFNHQSYLSISFLFFTVYFLIFWRIFFWSGSCLDTKLPKSWKVLSTWSSSLLCCVWLVRLVSANISMWPCDHFISLLINT